MGAAASGPLRNETELHLHGGVNTRQITRPDAASIILYVFARVAADGCRQDVQTGDADDI